MEDTSKKSSPQDPLTLALLQAVKLHKNKIEEDHHLFLDLTDALLEDKGPETSWDELQSYRPNLDLLDIDGMFKRTSQEAFYSCPLSCEEYKQWKSYQSQAHTVFAGGSSSWHK